MSHNVTESDTFSPTVQVPDVADTTYPTVVPAGMGELANRTRHHENTLTGNATFDALDVASASSQLATQYILPTTRLGSNNPFTVNITRLVQSFKWMKERLRGLKAGTNVIGFPPQFIVPASFPNWINDMQGGQLVAQQTTATSSAQVWFPLPGLPGGGLITTLGMRIKGNSAHADKPNNMPVITLERYIGSASGYAVGEVGTATDASADVTAYEAVHVVTISGMSEDLSLPPSGTVFWMARIDGEYGTNSIADGLFVYGLEMTITGPPSPPLTPEPTASRAFRSLVPTVPARSGCGGLCG